MNDIYKKNKRTISELVPDKKHCFYVLVNIAVSEYFCIYFILFLHIKKLLKYWISFYFQDVDFIVKLSALINGMGVQLITSFNK